MTAPLPRLDSVFGARLQAPRDALVTASADRDRVEQLGVATIDFADAPDWPVLDGLPDEALIETFLIAADASLTALSDAPVLDAWRERAEAFAERVVTACHASGVDLGFPCYLTCSITPSHLVEGNPHVDDDQLVPGTGIGVVAINGQHVGPRAADQPLALLRPATPGPLQLDDERIEAFRNSALPRAGADEIAVLGQFGQLHAGPATEDLAGASHRQLMVLRASTAPTD